MAKMMASFGQGFVQTQVLSENNSVKYKLAFAAGVAQSTPSEAYYTFQDEPAGVQYDGPGINLREFNPTNNQMINFKTFNIKPEDTNAGTKAFVDHMKTLVSSDNLLIITSYDRLYSSPSVEALMKSIGSVLWPSIFLTTNYSCNYCALYSINRKKIIAENATYSDFKKEDRDIRPALEFIYDKPSDIGATGYSQKAIDDPETYIINKDNTSKRFPRQFEQISPISEYGISPGDKMQWNFEVKGDASLNAPGQNIRVNLRWFKGSSYLSGAVVETNPLDADKWAWHQRYVTVPDTADGFTIIASRYPEVAGSEGSGAIREMMLTQVSRLVEPLMDPAGFGVNGIRMNNMISDGVNENTLLVLPDTEDDKSGNIYSADFREYND
ncbi:long tail fiber protein proximal connector [Enterobacter phage vB_VIPECLOM01]|nr:tail connector protein [Enterobacter phage vB_EclM-UFV01]WFG78696.1 long tail fiber protein proximal connector [Enterobacter phage vB_VIPECLOM01]